MLVEGAMIGVIGALIAAFVSFLLSFAIDFIVRNYIEEKIGVSFADDIFQFSARDVLFAFAIGFLVCTIASVIPAIRAARLDPVVAMRRK